MLKTVITALLIALALDSVAQGTFVRGADVSWSTEMEADGMTFCDRQGAETDIFRLMSDIGMNAVRLRVWVNPERKQPLLGGTAYGAWSDKADVVAKARRAKAAGLDVMIDFHYSDYFADPGRQAKPVAWEGLTFGELKSAVAEHTKSVLSALKAEGIEPRWVQVGNETNNGMIWPDGQIKWNAERASSFRRYADLSNAGYDAVKEILPDASVIVHHDRAVDDNIWFYDEFRSHGGKFDMIGLSHYPGWDSWQADNAKAVKNAGTIGAKFGVPVMICETGYSNYDPLRAEKVMADLMAKATSAEAVCGVLYWEPEVYGGWDHTYWDGTWHISKGVFGKEEVCNGAFTADGRPAPALLAISGQSATVVGSVSSDRQSAPVYDLQGRRVANPAKGMYIVGGRKTIFK